MKKKALFLLLIIFGLFSCSNKNQNNSSNSSSPSSDINSSLVISSNSSSSKDDNTSINQEYYHIYYDLGECKEIANIDSVEQIVRENDEYKIMIPKCEGYSFIKWINIKNNKQFYSGIFTYSEDIYLKAEWKKNDSSGWTDNA